MKKHLILLVLLSITVYAQKLTLKESLELGLKNNEAIKISESKRISSEAKVTEATSQLLPQLKFSAGYTRLSDIPPFEVQIPISPMPIRISEAILNNYSFRLSLQQPVFTGFRLSSLRSAAALNSKAAESDYSVDYNETAFKIHSAFWQLYKAEQILKLINENLSSMETHLNDTKNFLQNGLATQNDLLKLQVQYSNTKLQQIEAQNNVDVARYAFNQILGLPGESITEIDSEEISVTQTDIDFNQILEEAKHNRSELKSLQYRLQATEKSISAVRAGWFPLIYLSGNYYYSRPNQRILPALDKFKDTWDVGVVLNWDLWNWGLTSSQTTQAEQTNIQTKNTLAQLDEAVEIEVYQNLLTFRRSYEKIDLSKTTLEQANENYRITLEKYNVQLATSTDLIDAETSLLNAETNYSTALVDHEISRVRLDKSLGRKIY